MSENRATLELRPRIRQDVLFTQTQSGVLFHNADSGFHLAGKAAYRLASLIVPHMDGRLTVGELCAGLPLDRTTMIVELVSALSAHDYVRDYPAGAASELDPPVLASVFDEQINYIDHYADRATQRFMSFRSARVAVLGGDLIADFCALALVRNGSASVAISAGIGPAHSELRAEADRLASAGAPVSITQLGPADKPLAWDDLGDADYVVCAGADGPRQAMILITAGIPAGRRVMPVVAEHEHLIAGPLTPPIGSGGCWVCMALRLEANSLQPTSLWRRMCMGDSFGLDYGLTQTAGAMIGNLAGYEIFRLATGALPAETDGQALLLDTETFDTTAEAVDPHPRCAVCKAASADGRADADQELAHPVESSLADIDDPEPVVADLNQKSALISAKLGVLAGFDDDEITQMPLKATTVLLRLGGTGNRRLAAFDLHHVAGARRRAIMIAVSAYADRVVPVPETDQNSAGLRRVPPGELRTVTDTGAGNRDVGAWTAATSLLTGERLLVPAAAVRPFTALNSAGLFAASGAGAAASDSAARARYAALCSIVTFHAIQQVLSGAGHAELVAEAALADVPELRFLSSVTANLDATLELLELRPAATAGADARSAGLTTLLARLHRQGTGECYWATGTDTRWAHAAAGAIRDALGQLQLALDPAVTEPTDPGDPVVVSFDPAVLAPEGTARPVPDTELADLIPAIAACGWEPVAADMTSADLARHALSAVRVLLAKRAT